MSAASSPPALPPLSLFVTSRMQSAFRALRAATPVDERGEEYRSVASVLQTQSADSPPATITMQQLRTLSRLYRATLANDSSSTAASPAAATAAAPAADDSSSVSSPAATPSTSAAGDDPDSPGSGWLHELARGARVAPLPPPPRRKRSPEFERYLQEQRWKQERREYARMVADLPGNKNPEPSAADSNSFASVSRDIGFGLNILTLMATGFIVFFYLGTSLFPSNLVYQCLLGVLGLIGALGVEMGLFLVREGRESVHQSMKSKMQEAARKKEKERIQGEKIRQEMERRKKRMEEASKLQHDDALEQKLD